MAAALEQSTRQLASCSAPEKVGAWQSPMQKGNSSYKNNTPGTWVPCCAPKSVGDPAGPRALMGDRS